MSTITVQQFTKLVSEQNEIKKELSRLRHAVQYYMADELAPAKLTQYERMSKKLDRGGTIKKLKNNSDIRKFFGQL